MGSLAHEDARELTTTFSSRPAKVMAEDYRRLYNTHRPHSSLGYRTPNEFTLDRNNTNTRLTKTLVH